MYLWEKINKNEETDNQKVECCDSRAHLFFLQDDFLLQHFDGVEFVVGFELGEQDLHEGLFVSGLFGKHGLRHHLDTMLSGYYINPI